MEVLAKPTPFVTGWLGFPRLENDARHERLSYQICNMAADTAEELERFRQQWQQEVKEKSKAGNSVVSQKTKSGLGQNAEGLYRRAPSPSPLGSSNPTDGTGEAIGGHADYDLGDNNDTRRLGAPDGILSSSRQEPKSALEHYERAVEREGEGSLGDSLSHYRKAYRLDAGVDRLYKNKHFPPSSNAPKPLNPNPSNASVTVPNTAHHSLDGPSTLPILDLIASYQSSSIARGEPTSEASVARPCPIASVPSEILVKLLCHIAILDPASFALLSQVCRCFAYLVATEDRIWRRICMGREYGFEAMHYNWALTISGKALPTTIADLDTRLSRVDLDTAEASLATSPIYPTYKSMYHNRPRIRFNGCYISTVNYIRPGAATASQATWTSPVLIVTYYRYLRFFRDGTCASLLTTSEPTEVIHHLTKENLHTHHAGGLPSAVMNHALRGRWKLSGNPYSVDVPVEEEGTIHIETEGADADRPQPKYIYKLMLRLKSSGKSATSARNTKMAWLGYWSYNTLTDDWAEFNLKNDRAFFWSRVKSYGSGE